MDKVYVDKISQQFLRDRFPCSHIGCLNHISHPCELCGRKVGIADMQSGRYCISSEELPMDNYK